MHWVVLLLIAFFSTVAHSAGADWRAFATIPENDGLLFYSALDIKHDGTSVQVWTEVLKGSEVVRVDEKAHPDLRTKADERMARGYRPPMAEHHPNWSPSDLGNTVL